MNKENIQRLIDFLNQSETFIMSSVKNSCGTPGCIIGHWMAMEDKKREFNVQESFKEFSEYLDIPVSEAIKICVPDNQHKEWRITSDDVKKSKRLEKRFISKSDAVRMLEHLKATEKVEWNPNEWNQDDALKMHRKKIVEKIMKSVEETPIEVA